MQFSWSVIGQENIRHFLEKSLNRESISHGYFFLGSKDFGVEKAGLEFAQALLCLKKDGVIPCQTCLSCRSFLLGQHPDFLLLKPLNPNGKIGVEEVRDFIRNFSRSIVLGQRKVSLILQAEKLTIEAQNALLKILEEPQKSRVCLLTSANLLLPTITSRLQILKFRPVDGRTIGNYFESKFGSSKELKTMIDLSFHRPELIFNFLSDPENFLEYKKRIENFMSLFSEVKNFHSFAKDILGNDIDKARQNLNELFLLGLYILNDLAINKIKNEKSTICSFLKEDILETLTIQKIVFLLKELFRLRRYIAANVSPYAILENFYLLIH